jgi:hypothetical protein
MFTNGIALQAGQGDRFTLSTPMQWDSDNG